MTKAQRKQYQKAVMIRINTYLKKHSKATDLFKQNKRIREFAKQVGLAIPINKGCLDWAIELYLSKENEHCSQGTTVSKTKRKPAKCVTRYDDVLIETAKEIDAVLDSGEGKYVKMKFAMAYLIFYRGNFEQDLEALNTYVHTDDLQKFLNETTVNHGKYLRSLKWAQLKDYVRERDNYICSCCGSNLADDLYHLHTHHLTYERLGDENPDTDLVLLCSDCHSKEHSKPKV
jgi:hypothetical protein